MADSLYLVIGTIVNALSMWMLIAVTAHATDPETVGRLALGLAIVTPIFVFSNLQLRTLQVCDVGAAPQFSRYLGLRYVTCAAALGLIGMITMLGSYSRSTRLVVGLVAIQKTFDALSDIYYGEMQKRGLAKRIALSFTLRALGTVGAMTAIITVKHSLIAGLIAALMCQACVFVIHDVRLVDRTLAGVVKSHRDILRLLSVFFAKWRPLDGQNVVPRLIRLSFPMAVAASLINSISNVPRYFVAAFLGEAALGIFTSIYYVVIAANLISDAVAQATVRAFGAAYARGKMGEFNKILLIMSGISTLGAGMCAVVLKITAPYALAIYGKAYVAHIDILSLLLVSVVLNPVCSLLRAALSGQQRMIAQLGPSVASIVACIVVSYFCIPKNGLLGAASAVAVASGVQGIALALVLFAQTPQKRIQNEFA